MLLSEQKQNSILAHELQALILKIAQKLGIKDDLINAYRELEKVEIPKDITTAEKHKMEKEYSALPGYFDSSDKQIFVRIYDSPIY